MFGDLHEYGALGRPVTKAEALKAITSRRRAVRFRRPLPGILQCDVHHTGPGRTASRGTGTTL